MRLGVATQRSIEWASGTLSYLEAGAPGDPAILLLNGLGHVSYVEDPGAFESALLSFLNLEKA
jgi:pimeloyl-ACP methyl ester carboxylesterase